MKMYIPEIGDKITLDADWKFDWINDSRNLDVIFRLSNGLFEYPFDKETNGVLITAEVYRYNPWDSVDNQCEFFYYNSRYQKLLLDKNKIKIRRKLYHTLFESKSSTFKVECTKPEMLPLSIAKEVTYTFEVETEVSEPRITIPKDTVLEIDRIYIRKGLEEYSSISFLVDSSPEVAYKPKADLKKLGLGHITKKHKMRFFAKLKDVNQIEFR